MSVSGKTHEKYGKGGYDWSALGTRKCASPLQSRFRPRLKQWPTPPMPATLAFHGFTSILPQVFYTLYDE